MSKEPRYFWTPIGKVVKSIVIDSKRTWSEIQKSTGLEEKELNSALATLYNANLLFKEEDGSCVLNGELQDEYLDFFAQAEKPSMSTLHEESIQKSSKIESRSIIIGIIIGILVGATPGYVFTPRSEVSALSLRILELEETVNTYESELNTIGLEYEDLQQQYGSSSQQINDLQNEKNALEASLLQKNVEIASLNNEVSNLSDVVTKYEEIIIGLENVEAELESVEAEFVLTSFSRTEDTSSVIRDWIGKANETVKVMVMLITQNEIADALIAAHVRGVDVDVVIESDWMHSYGSDYQILLTAGIDVRGDERVGLMHHKVMIVDDYVIIIGSYDWSERSEVFDDDNLLIMESDNIAEDYLKEFSRLWNQTKPYEEPVEDNPPEDVNHLVVINEVEQNPSGINKGNEWVELYNPSNYDIDISGWKISSTNGETVTIKISQNTTLNSGEYMIITYHDQWIDNENEKIVLKDDSNITIDKTPILNDKNNDSQSWQRYPNGKDTDSVSDWEFKSSTKGNQN